MIFKSTDNAEKIKEQFVRKVKEDAPKLFADVSDSIVPTSSRWIFTVDAFLLRVKNCNYYILDEITPLYLQMKRSADHEDSRFPFLESREERLQRRGSN